MMPQPTTSFLRIVYIAIATTLLAFPTTAGASVDVGDTPDLEFTAANGVKVNRAYLKGKLVIVDFWASWCGPCIAALPHMKKLHAEYGSKGVEILGVSLDRSKDAMTRFVKDKGLKWLQYYDEGSKMGRIWGVRGIPTLFLLSPKGKVLWTGNPMQLDWTLAKAMKEYLKKADLLTKLTKDTKKAVSDAQAALKAGDYAKMLKAFKGMASGAVEDEKIRVACEAIINKLNKSQDTVQKVRAAMQADAEAGRAFIAVMMAIDEAKRVNVGDTPTIDFTATDGTKVNKKYLSGKIVVVDFWATWCGPCVAAIPLMREIHRKYHSQGVQIIGISLDRSRASFERMVKDKKLDWPHYYDGKHWKNEISTAWGVQGIPAVYILSPRGKVVWKGHAAELERQLKKALKKYSPKKT